MCIFQDSRLASEMAQWAKASEAEPDTLGLDSGTQRLEGENQLLYLHSVL